MALLGGEQWVNQTAIGGQIDLFMGVWEPFVNPCILTKEWGDSDCKAPGINFEIFSYIMTMLNVTIVKHTVPKPEYGKRNPDGTYNGVLGDTMTGKYDSIIIYYYMSPQRIADDIPFSFPISFHSAGSLGYIVKRPSKFASLGSPKLLFRVLPLDIWVYFLILMVMITIALCLAIFCRARRRDEEADRRRGTCRTWMISTLEAFWEVVKMALDEYDSHHRAFTAVSIPAVTMAFLCLFFWTFYTASLLETLLSGSFKPPFTSMDELADLVENDGFQLLKEKGGNTLFYDEVAHSELSQYKKLNASLMNHPPILEPNLTKLLDMVEENPKLVFPGRTLLNDVGLSFNRGSIKGCNSSVIPKHKMGMGLLRGRCNLMFIKENTAAPYSMGWVFSPDSPLRKPFSHMLAGLSPMIANVENKYIEDEMVRSRKDCPPDEEENQPLRMIHFYGILGISIAICIAATVVLVVEISMRSVKSKAAAIFTTPVNKVIGKIVKSLDPTANETGGAAKRVYTIKSKDVI